MELVESREYKAGWDAFWQAWTIGQNPYFGKPGSDDWVRGYSAAVKAANDDYEDWTEKYA